MKHIKLVGNDYLYNEQGDLFIQDNMLLKPVKLYNYNDKESYCLYSYHNKVRCNLVMRKDKFKRLYKQEDIIAKMTPIKVGGKVLDDYYINEKSYIYSCITNNYIKHQKIGFYLAVSLHGKLEYVNRLMGETFIGDVKDLSVIHKDGDKHNNNLYNLEIITRAESGEKLSKAYKESGIPRRGMNGPRVCAVAYYIDEYTYDGVFIKRYDSCKIASPLVHIPISTLMNMCDKVYDDIVCKIGGIYYHYSGEGELLYETGSRIDMINYVKDKSVAYSKTERPLFFRNRYRRGPKHRYRLDGKDELDDYIR